MQETQSTPALHARSRPSLSQLLSRADAASVFARTARRYGSADAAVHNRTKHSCSPTHNQPQHRQHTRQGRARRSRHECRSHPGEEGPYLDFQQFVSAIGGVIELLTVGCDDDDDGIRVGFNVGGSDLVGDGGCFREKLSAATVASLRDRGSRSPESDSWEIGLNHASRTGTPTACFGAKGGQKGRGNGEGDGRETYGVCSSGRRTIAMTPGLAKTRLVRLAKVRRCRLCL